MKKIFGLFVILTVFVTAGCSNNKIKKSERNHFYYDVEQIKVDLSASSSVKELYNPEPWEELQAEIMAGKISRNECVRKIRKLLMNYKIAHLQIRDLEVEADPNPKIRPFGFYCFSDGYYVTSAEEKNSKYLGWKLSGIGDCSMEELQKKLIDFYGCETPSGERYAFESFYYYDDFKELDLVKNGKISFTLESPDGKRETVKLKPIYMNTKKVQLESEKTTPFYHPRDKNPSYSVKPSKENRTIYIPFNACMVREDYTIEQWFSDIGKELQTGDYDTIVFDLRYNGGGLMMLTDNAMFKYKSLFEKYNMAIVASGRTYSAATEFMDMALRLYPNVKIFGEETGQAVFNYTGLKFLNLKYLNIQIAWPGFVDEVPELYARAKDIHRGTFPDVEVGETSEGYLNGEDSIYKAIYEYFN